MSNELIFSLIAVFSLCFALIATYMGRSWLFAFILAANASLLLGAAKLTDTFGFTTSVVLPLYAGVFFATDIITERYGKKEGMKIIFISFTFVIFIQCVLFLSNLSTPINDVTHYSDALKTIFDGSWRIVVAGLTAYILAQSLDIWIYHRIHQWSGDKHLWLRNNASTIISQTVDTCIFVFIAFYGVLENWYEVIYAGLLLKWALALIDTPFMYIAKRIKSRDTV